MQAIDLLVLPRWIVPIEPAGLVLQGHALAVDGGRIVALLPVSEAEARYQPRETLTLPTQVVMPGLINAHTHAAMSLLRGIADDLPLMDWLQNHIWPAEGAHVSKQFCIDGVKLAAAELIRGGVTTANDMYFFPDASAEGFTAAGMRSVVNLITLDFPTAWAANADEYLHKGLVVRDSLKHNPLVTTIFGPHAPYTVGDAPLRKIRTLADELGIGIHMHVHETAGEVAMAVEQTGKRPWQRLKDLELLGPDFVAVHMTQLTEQEIAEAAEFGVHVAHCPESNLKLASGFCPVDQLLKAGVNVCIGTDGAASNNDLDLFGELKTAALLAKAVAGDAQALPAHAALHMATLAGAKALGLDEQIGSLVAGKQADFIAVDLSAINTQPVYHVLSHLAYAVNSQQVTDVFVAGKPLLKSGVHTTLSVDEVLAKASEWARKIRP